MNWVDILVLVVWGLMALWGFKSGFIGMIVPLVVIILGLAISSRIAEPVGNLFSFLSANENVQTIIAFIAIFLALIILSAWLSALLQTVSKVIPLAGPVDRLSGMFIGIIVGFLFLSGILTGLQHFTVGRIQTDIAASPLGTFMTDNFGVTIRAVKLVPGDWDEKAKGFQSGLQDGAGELKEKVEKLKQIDKSGDPEKFPPQ
ncbi:MAG: CvpA family protein [Chloroflexi bacterium]|nr:CvpA family protein [Chloroflexota bacterium]